MFNLFAKTTSNASAQQPGRSAEMLMPLIVAALGKYADDCLQLSFAMIHGEAASPKLDVLDFEHIDTLRQWSETAPVEGQNALAAVVGCYQAQAIRFKAWIVQYNLSSKAAYTQMTQGERDLALAHDTAGAVRATLELRLRIEALWCQVSPNTQPAPDMAKWLESKFLYCNEQVSNWAISSKYFSETIEK